MDHISTQEVIRSLISFTEKVHDKGSKETQQTMIEFSKYKNKTRKECSKMTLSGRVSKNLVLGSGAK